MPQIWPAMAAAVVGDSCSSSTSPASSSPSSPRHRLKFLCSYGGKILPRPSDGQLKYIGGDTRVLVVHRSISYSELKGRIHGMFRLRCVIKYQLTSEDLDTLVTVSRDEDLAHMLDEYDRLDALHPRSPSAQVSPRFRLYIFPSPSSSSDRAGSALDQRYIDAMNAAVSGCPRRPPIFSISTSPTSTIDGPGALVGLRPNSATSGSDSGMHQVQSNPKLGGAGMQRVHSTPNLRGGCVSVGQKGNGGAGPQHHHNRYHHNQLLPPQIHLPHRQQIPALPAQGNWRASVAPRHDGCGFQVPQTALRGGYRYGGGKVCFRSADESTWGPSLVREHVIWEQHQ